MKRYNTRQERAQYAAIRYAEYIGASVLDVGGDMGYLRKYIAGEYVCLDVAGAADICVDLDQGLLPYPTHSFETVVCLDVLEHLENLHGTFEELIRVSSRHVILSLPNVWQVVDSLRGGHPRYLRHYGLPLYPPPDRHRWFYSYTDAVQFVRGMAARTGSVVRVCEPYYKVHQILGRVRQALRWVLWDRDRYNNLEALTLWAVLEKGDRHA